MTASDGLSQWDLKILSSTRKEAKSEKKIAKDIALNVLTTSQLITGLMSKNYIERTVNRARIRRYSYTEKFGITQEGLFILEKARRNSPWNQLTDFLREESDELPLKMTITAVTMTYKLAKFVLKA